MEHNGQVKAKLLKDIIASLEVVRRLPHGVWWAREADTEDVRITFRRQRRLNTMSREHDKCKLLDRL